MMAIVAMFSGSHCRGDEVSRLAAERLGYPLINERLMDRASSRSGLPRERLLRALTGTEPFFNRYTHERERGIAHLKAALAEAIADDGLFLHGPASHLIPKGIRHVLHVCIIAQHAVRIRRLEQEGGLSERDAAAAIGADDEERAELTRRLRGRPPYDTGLYDLLIPVDDDAAIEDAAEKIRVHAQSPQLEPSETSRRAVGDFRLASEVNLALMEEGHVVDVSAEDGRVTIVIERPVLRMNRHQKTLAEIAGRVPGVTAVECRLSRAYRAPSLNPWSNLEMPPRVLLVDDEEEYVYTLSERLRRRDIESSVVLSGQEALDFAQTERPDVMVLDLMMPGIDGIEVLRRVKALHPNIEVIILTGHGSEREERLAEELGAFAYLQKPVDVDELALVMQDAYRRVGKTNPSAPGGGG